jgi:hypothetical protein
VSELFIEDSERKELIDYIGMKNEDIADKTGESIEYFVRNVILILNLFFEYGF